MGDDLYREICRTPGDDTLRLAYADWLDEHGDPDRAEFVRAWYELEGMPAYRGIDISLNWSDPKFSPECRRAAHLRRREGELLRLHPEWSRCPCRECEGRGRILGPSVYGYSREWEACDICFGTGDLFLAFGVSGASLTPPPKPRAVTFARGLPDSVTCTLAEAFAPDGVPTPWACEVVRRTPVTRFVLTDKTPAWDRHGDGMATWYNGTDVMLPAVITAAVPGVLLAEMTGEISVVAPPRLGKWFHDVPAAVAALALAAGRLVRRHVYGEVTQ